MDCGRIRYEKPAAYANKKVLIYNWYENLCSYTKNPVRPTTTYNASYTPKPYSSWINEFVWDRKIEQEGLGPRILFDHGKEEYLENMSSLYDLSYNHFPKWYKSPIYRTWRFKLQEYDPTEEYLVNHGNITQYGLKEIKREQWRCERQDPRITLTTHNQDTYQKPKLEDLVTHHFATPLINTSKINPVNDQLRILKLRNRPIFSVTDPQKLVVKESIKSKCNPITWECSQEIKKPLTRCFRRGS